jgi:DNA-binding transcriptional LysR family regulator
LLVVLDALISERHVTRAGLRIGLSQPATSNALERLRRLFDDPLLERVPRGLKLTPRAEALREPLGEVLRGAAALVSRDEAVLATLNQSIRLSVVDYWIPVFMGTVLESIAREAPGLDVLCLPWAGASATHAGLQTGSLDLAMSLVAPSTLRFEPVRHETYVLAMRRGHPAERHVRARWLDYPHIVVSGDGSTTSAADTALAGLTPSGKKRRVALVVPSFLAVPGLLVQSDSMALIPDTVARLASGITWTKPPLPIAAGFDVALVWHARRDADLATAFLRDEIAKAVRAREKNRR